MPSTRSSSSPRFFGLAATLTHNVLIGCLFTLTSIVRSYVLRRVFEVMRPASLRASPLQLRRALRQGSFSPMTSRRDQHSQDLFVQRDEAAPRETVSPLVRASFLLPSNLDVGLRALDDEALLRLRDAVERKAQRRFPQPIAHPVAPPATAPPRKKTLPRPSKAASEPGIAVGRANMIGPHLSRSSAREAMRIRQAIFGRRNSPGKRR